MKRLLGVGSLMIALASPLAAQDIGLELGTKVEPAVALATLDGKAANLDAWVGKKPVLLEFWATWCGNCEQLHPHLDAMHKKYGAQVEFIAVAVSFNQSVTRAKLHVEKHGIPWKTLYDDKGNAGSAYDAPATSYIVVLDASGRVVYTGLGGRQDLEPALKKAIGG